MSDFLNRIVIGVNGNTCAATNKTANNVFLDTTINESDLEIGSPSFDMERVFGADSFDKVDCARIHEGLVFVGIVFFSDNDTGKARSAFAEEGDDSAGVNTGNGGDPRARAPR
jgi:hypothetical protein